MKNAANRKFRDHNTGMKNKLIKAAMIAGSFVFAAGACIGIKNNSDWYSVRKDVVPTSVHVTNYEESVDRIDNGDGAITMLQNYHLVGTYENNSGNKSVLVLNEAYSDKAFADKQIGSDRNVYLNTSTFGAAGIKEVSVPDFDKSFVPFVTIGAAVSLVGTGLFIYTKKTKQKLADC